MRFGIDRAAEERVHGGRALMREGLDVPVAAGGFPASNAAAVAMVRTARG